MTRVLVALVVLVAAALTAVILWPRDNDGRTSAPTQSVNSTGAVETGNAAGRPASFTVLVEGQAVQEQQVPAQSRMSDLPPTAWNSSMISSIKSVGTSQVLVFVDGSEALVDNYTRERLPEEVAFRAGYSRE